MSLSKFQSTHSLRSATRGNSVEQRSVPCFNPRTPCGVRRMPGMMWPTATTFQSTHSLRSATRRGRQPGGPAPVSIHALLAECDGQFRRTNMSENSFNPRTPCGVRQGADLSTLVEARFQSTHSLRSATHPIGDELTRCAVSIHALLAECDQEYVKGDMS